VDFNACQDVKLAIKSSKENAFKSAIQSCNGDQQKIFRITDRLLGRTNQTILPNSDDPLSLATKFNNYFIKKIDDIRNGLNSTSSYSFGDFQSIVPDCFPSLSSFRPTDKAELEKLISNMNKTTCASDPIPTSFIVQHLPLFLDNIGCIVNLCLSTGVFPSTCKSSIVRPLLKKAGLDKDDLKNYRPVANLPFLSKIIEKVIAVRINEHLEKHSIMDKFQSAYRKSHSTETSLLFISEHIRRSIDRGGGSALLLLDLSAAFDTIDCDILMDTLENYVGLTGNTSKLLKSYISHRYQCVKIEQTTSKLSKLVCGVPQGSVLGPLLFCLYLLPLSHILKFHNMDYHIYADDTQLFMPFQSGDMQDTIDTFERCIGDIRHWMTSSKLKINDAKTELIFFRSPLSKLSTDDISIQIGNNVILPSDNVQNLGVVFDKHMTFEKQIGNVCKRTHFQLMNIRKIRTMLDDKSAALVIHALVTSRFDLYNSLLYGLSDKSLLRLRLTQNYAARILSNTSRYSSITPVLRALHWLPVRFRIRYKIVLFAYKCYHRIAPSYLCDLVIPYESVRLLRSTNKMLLTVPKYRLKTQGERSFSYAASFEWNRIPLQIKQANNIDLFKKLLKTHLFQKAFVVVH